MRALLALCLGLSLLHCAPAVGAACTAKQDCGALDCVSTQPGGLCSRSCDEGTPCPDDAVCSKGVCQAGCASASCRDGYSCTALAGGKACIAPCLGVVVDGSAICPFFGLPFFTDVKVAVGGSTSQSFVVSNGGRVPVTVSGAEVTAAGFSVVKVSALPATLAPGESVGLGATFAPTAAGCVDGEVVVHSDAANAPALRVPVHACGT